MGTRNLRAVLAHAVAAGTGLAGVADRDLLRRFHRDRDEGAFAELVRRHARLVWAACRHLLPTDADAEDAFQATFLALARNPGAVRDGGRVGPFLHGVAVRVCSKARRSSSRRREREQIAGRVGPGPAVPDSAWDRALAAVHAEAARLPDALRVPFVLCCLEGKGATEAADLLGWKLGTLSGRLTRAKQTLLSRLEARGLSAGAVVAATAAGGATAGVPAGAVGKVLELVRPGVAVAGSVLHLSQGVVGMTAYRLKLLAAGVLVAGGLTATVGPGWLATADAQAPGAGAAAAPPGGGQVLPTTPLGWTFTANPSARTWEYRYVRQNETTQTPTGLEHVLAKNEAEGWAYVGEAPLRDAGAGGPAAPTLVFRRPTAAVAAHAHWQAEVKGLMANCTSCHAPNAAPAGNPGTAGPVKPPTSAVPVTGTFEVAGKHYEMFRGPMTVQARAAEGPKVADPADPGAAGSAAVRRPETAAEAEAVAAQIAMLQARLIQLKAATGPVQKAYRQADLPLGAGELADVLGRLAAKRAGGGKLTFGLTDPGGLTVIGDEKSVEWAAGVIRQMAGK